MRISSPARPLAPGPGLSLLAVALLASGCATTSSPALEGEPTLPGGELAPGPSTAHPSMRASWDAYAVPGSPDGEASVVIATGQGRVEVEPDRARVSFAVETEAQTAAEAGSANAERMERVMAAVRRQMEGVPGLRIETSGYTLNPRYGPARQDEGRQIVGYTARNSVVVTVDEVEAVARVMDTALRSGANRMSGLTFHLQDPEPHRRAALRNAIASARAEAEVMAEALGMALGEPLQVQGGAEQPIPRGPMAFEMARAMDAPATTPVEAGLQAITASVTVRFRLLSPPR